MRLNWEEEQKKVKKWRTLQKVKNYGAHKKRSQTLHNKYLKQWLQSEGGAKYTEEKYVITACREVKEEKRTKKEEQKKISELQYHPYVLWYVKNLFWGLITYDIKIFMRRKKEICDKSST